MNQLAGFMIAYIKRPRVRLKGAVNFEPIPLPSLPYSQQL
jgi:hypothetical protein